MAKKTNKTTKVDVDKLMGDIISLLKDLHAYSDIDFVVKGKRIHVGSSDILWDEMKDDDDDIKYSEPKVTVKESKDIMPSNWGGNDETLLIQYDGGYMYSIMSGEFGYSTRDAFESGLDLLLVPYGLTYEEVDHISLSFYRD